MHDSIKPLLLGGVAVAAITIGCFGADPAAAQCTTSGSTVTCSGATTDSQAQLAIYGATAPDLSLIVNQGATLASAQRSISTATVPRPSGPNGVVLSPTFSGTVSVTNAGVIGTSPTLTTDLVVVSASRFIGANSGVLNGSLVVGSSQFFGIPPAGSGSFANTGTVAGSVSLQGAGDQSYTGNGAIQGGSFPFNGLSLTSRTSSTTTAADGTQTTTVTGGTATATVDGVLRSTATQPTALRVVVSGIGGAAATIGGTTGGVSVTSQDANIVSRNTSSFQGGNFSSLSTFNSQAVGGAAVLTVNSAATVNGDSSVRGLTSATAIVNGTMAPAPQNSSLSLTVVANAADTTFASSQNQSGTGATFASAFQSANTSTSRGGTASATVAAGGNVVGDVSVTGGSTATATVNGAIGGTTFPNSVSVTAGAVDSTGASTSRSDATGSSSTSSSSTTQRGGAASATVGTTGAVAGAVQVSGISNAVAAIAGTVGTAQNTAGVSVSAQGSDTTFSSSGSSTPATGSTSTSTDTRTARAGTASATIASTARIFGGVSVSGGTSATASIDGAVGSAGNFFGGVTVSTGGSDGQTTRTSTSPAGGTFTQVQESVSTERGGAASVTVGTTGSVIGSVSASSTRGPATATLAGHAGVANPQNFSPTPSFSAIASGSDIRSTSTSASNRNAFSNSSTAVGGQATATVLSGGIMSGDVAARGDAGATITNAGTVVRALRLTAGAANTTNSSDNSGSSTTTGGVTTSINRSMSGSSSTPVVADGSVTNTGTAGSVAATATGNLAFRNDGTVAGNVALNAGANASTSESSSPRVTMTTPASGGGATIVATNTNLSGSTGQAIGGNVVATYNGVVGINPVDPQQTQLTLVSQSAVSSSTATVAGLILGSFTSSTGGANTSTNNSTVSTTTTQPLVGAGSPAATDTTVVANRSSRTVVGGPSSVTVTGAVRNDGTGSSGVTVQAATGSASALVSGGTIVGSLVVTAGQGTNSTTTLDRTTTSARAASPTFSSSFIEQTSNQVSLTVTQLAGGTAAATLTGATVGSVQMSGVGTGRGSAAATATVDTASTVGAFTVGSGGLDRRTDQTVTLADNVRTIVTTLTDTVSALAGNARANVAGRIGAAAVTSQGGNATLNLTGVAIDAVGIAANAFDRVSSTTQTFAVTSPQGFAVSRQTGQNTVTTTTAGGGVATLAIAGSSAVQAAGTNTVGGAITVDGFGGSVLTVANGSRVLANNGGSVRVAGTAVNATTTTVSRYDPTTGVFTGSTSRQTVMSVAGPASITNAGVIGTPNAYFSAPVSVRAESVGGATIANTGQIYGDVAAAGLGERRDLSSTQTPATATTPFTNTATTTFTPIEAAARLTNAGLISGRAEVSGGTGSITNAGVIRGTAQLGASVRNYTSTVTTTSVVQQDGTVTTTNVTSPASPPAALFGQTLTLDQNGLLLGGVRVEGATTADPANGAVIRTSTINATVNLNAGSVTLGDVTGQQDATGRLTRTTVNLTGDGFLGAGPTLQTVQSESGVRFAAVPNYAAFAAIDPALGTTDAAGFTPAVTLTSGSRINGVDAVIKTGGGAFTIVGASLLRTAGATTYTIDAPLVRVASGELQLGVVGVDPATGQGVFGVRGSVQNDGTLVVGRRITNGTLSGVQGVTLSVTGNVTQSAGGTLVLAAAPQPALVTAPALVTTPSFLNVDGALSLGGVLNISAPQGIYVTGRGPDFASVGGAFTSTATVAAPSSPFVTFGIATRVEGGRTIASINVTRTPFASVATNGNAAAAGGALQAAIPAAIAAGAGSDAAAVIGRLDAGTAAGAAATLDELGQASFYGSLAAVSITRPFGEVSDLLAGIDTDRERPVSLWMRMGGSLSRIRGDAGTGARRLIGNNLGAIVGVDLTSGGVSVGVGVGPGWTDASAGIGRGRANGWMVGAYAAARVGPLSLAGQGVMGWSDWNVSRTLSSFGRYATTSLDQREVRLNGRAAIDLSVGDVSLSPFAGMEWRQWRFDGFSERNAGTLGVRGGRFSDSVLSPEAGARIAGTAGRLRAFVEGAYVFQGNVAPDRTFSLVGVPGAFTVRGVTPDDYGRIASGIETDIGQGSFFVRGDMWEGGGNRLGAVRVGARVRF